MYLNLHQLSPLGQPLGKPKSKSIIRYRIPVGLSVNLTRPLQNKLYQRLYEYPTHAPTVSTLYLDDTDRTRFLDSLRPASSLTCDFVRDVRILQGEFIGHIFNSEHGLISEPSPQGRMLLLTNQRVIAFGKKANIRETVIVPLKEIKIVSVTVGKRTKGTLFQGGIMMVAAVLLYVILAYWLTGRIDGPQVPIVRMDLVAFIAFLAVLLGVAVLAQIYFTKPYGEVMFQGDGIKFTFSFRGDTSEKEIYVLVNTAFSARQGIVG